MAVVDIHINFDPAKESLTEVLAQIVHPINVTPVVTTVAKPETPAVEDPQKWVKDNPEPEAQPAAGPETQAEPPADPAPEGDGQPETVTKTDIRAVATKLSKAGKSAALKTIFAKFGGNKLSDIKEEDYPALMAALREESDG